MSNWPPSGPVQWPTQPGGPGQSNTEYPVYPPAYGPTPSVPLTPGYPPPPPYGAQPVAGAPGQVYGVPVQPTILVTPAIAYTPVIAYAPVAPANPPEPGSGLAVAGLVVGILGLVFFWFPACFVGIPLAILGVIFSGVGIRSKSRRGTAIAGLVCSLVALLLSVGFYSTLFAALTGHP